MRWATVSHFWSSKSDSRMLCLKRTRRRGVADTSERTRRRCSRAPARRQKDIGTVPGRTRVALSHLHLLAGTGMEPVMGCSVCQANRWDAAR